MMNCFSGPVSHAADGLEALRTGSNYVVHPILLSATRS